MNLVRHVNGKTILSVSSPVTQTAEAVKQLIEYVSGKPCDDLPAVFALANGAQLTRSSKSDSYYVTTPTACSCPGRTYHPGQPCKHMKALLRGEAPKMTEAQAYQARQRGLRAKSKAGSYIPEPEGARRLARPPEDREPFRPVMPEAEVA